MCMSIAILKAVQIIRIDKHFIVFINNDKYIIKNIIVSVNKIGMI